MKLTEFKEQDAYCKENNTPTGKGCDDCPATDKEHCADALRNLCGKFLDSIGKHEELEKISRQLECEYGIVPYSQLSLLDGFIDFSE